jgi:hypothetical protein
MAASMARAEKTSAAPALTAIATPNASAIYSTDSDPRLSWTTSPSSNQVTILGPDEGVRGPIDSDMQQTA